MTNAQIKRYPVRGGLYGLLIGFTLAYFVFFKFTLFPFETLNGTLIKFALVVLFGVALGVVFAYVAPPKRGGAPPAAVDDSPPPAAPDTETPTASEDE